LRTCKDELDEKREHQSKNRCPDKVKTISGTTLKGKEIFLLQTWIWNSQYECFIVSNKYFLILDLAKARTYDIQKCSYN
jgi:hypothetical protein